MQAWLPWMLAWIGLASLTTLILMLVDKRRAVQRRARISERTLLLMALAGGSPGTLAGMVLARHKTRKASFIGRYALVLGLQAVVLVLAWHTLRL